MTGDSEANFTSADVAKEAAGRARSAIEAIPDADRSLSEERRIHASPIGRARRKHHTEWGLKAVTRIDGGTLERWLARDLVEEIAQAAAAIMNEHADKDLRADNAVAMAWDERSRRSGSI